MLKTNPQLDLARKFVTETGANIFLTGKAGTGKTTFLRSVVESISKRYIIVAPTGVAALNAGGVTIHSFFQLPFGPQIPNETRENNFYRLSRDKTAIMRSLELLVIDEISMVRSDLLDAINLKLQKIRRNNSPFGGVQLLMIGDVRQLSPICKPDEWSLLKESYKSPYFFDALSLRESSYITIELLQIFRQSDSEFTNLLNSIRDNRLTQSDLQKLNSRYIDNFKFCRDDDYIMLTTHNSKAAGVNHAQLSSIDSEIYDFDATIEGEFSESIYPNETTLNLKVGAQVIFVKNDSSSSKEFYNGMIATITNIRDEKVTVIPKASNQEITVPMATWDNIEYTIDSESGDIKERVVGSFKQLPIKCAWAITIHKSQGLTFDKVIIDASESFAPGQVYVALSRCRTFEGIILSSKINSLSIIDNSNVSSFCRFVEGNQPDDNILEIERKRYFRSVVCDIFDFEKLRYSLHQAQRLLNNSLLNKHFEITQELNEHTKLFEEELFNVGERFKQQLSAMIFESDDYSTSPLIEERLQKAATYFAQRIETTADIAKQIFKITPTAKEVKKRLKNITSELKIELEIKMMAIEMCSDSFSIEEYLLYKMRITTGRKSRDKKSISTKKIASIESDNSTDAIYPELHNTLTIWRKEEAQKLTNQPL